MERLKRVATSAITYPVREYRKFRDYRHQRINDAPITWNLSAWKRLHPSLRQGYKYCLVIVASIWALVLVFSVWLATVHEAQAGLVYTLQTGSCSAAQNINFWVHLVVNGLASTLYAISSYIMQRLAAPGREDIDRAHDPAVERPMKIGSLAFTNFIVLSKKRLCVFFLLWASSLPLHLLFNSVIVYTSTNAEWPSHVYLTSEEEFKSIVSRTPTSAVSGVRQYDEIPKVELGEDDDLSKSLALEAQALFHQQPPMIDLRLDECIDTFGSGSSETWGDVILVHSTNNQYSGSYRLKSTLHSKSYLPAADEDPWQWMCGSNRFRNVTCDAKKILDSGRWMVNDLVISRCLARKLPALCELNASLAILIAVFAAVSVKLIAIVFAVVLGRTQSLLTIGDAIASFLEEPDKYLPPLRRSQLTYRSRRRMVMLEMRGAFLAAAIFGAVGLSLAWWFFAFVFHETSAAFSLSKTPFDFDAMLRYGFGKMPSRWSETLNQHLLSYSAAEDPYFTYTSGAVLANLPQLALSAFYLVFNNYVTRLFVALEFRAYSTRRRGLRVSQPVKHTKQRRAYFLQIPLRYSLLNIALFALLHTFLSQTLFLRRVYAIYPQSFDGSDEIGKKLLPMIGYSPVAGFAFAVLLTSLVLAGVVIGLTPLDWRMLDTSGDSLAIGQACHPPEGSCKTHEGAIRWGVTNRCEDGSVKCSFSLLPVRPPDLQEVIKTRARVSS
ncbi:hypothetical protein F5B22DRAFT_285637 [Xylaria bambusicola]|uniref:uncharacterized protein n=1 Tax=Xylaria bambusicola TaxID=326684 RepID=UPI002008E9A8|nr:uncharacterized protein F5B22DRAFT_285637 [Xylaria bambusicola]KAI0513062.1 hypothetical protein F5B22DRAFT_285637 [Xylaria bambusicola]